MHAWKSGVQILSGVVARRMRVMNEILLAATMAWMSANFALLPLPGWPLMSVGPSHQRTADSSTWHAIGPETEIWCALPSGGVDIDWHDLQNMADAATRFGWKNYCSTAYARTTQSAGAVWQVFCRMDLMGGDFFLGGSRRGAPSRFLGMLPGLIVR